MKKRSSGFTLIELMIGVVVVGILVAVALPSYLEHVNKGRRAEGKSALMRAIQLQERFYTTNGTYASTAAQLQALFGATGTVYSTPDDPNSDRGRYTLTVEACGAEPATACINVLATVNTANWSDAKCGNFGLNTRGVRTASNAADADTLAYCWR